MTLLVDPRRHTEGHFYTTACLPQGYQSQEKRELKERDGTSGAQSQSSEWFLPQRRGRVSRCKGPFADFPGGVHHSVEGRSPEEDVGHRRGLGCYIPKACCCTDLKNKNPRTNPASISAVTRWASSPGTLESISTTIYGHGPPKA